MLKENCCEEIGKHLFKSPLSFSGGGGVQKPLFTLRNIFYLIFKLVTLHPAYCPPPSHPLPQSFLHPPSILSFAPPPRGISPPLAIPVSGRLSASSPIEPERAAQLEEHIPNTGIHPHFKKETVRIKAPFSIRLSKLLPK